MKQAEEILKAKLYTQNNREVIRQTQREGGFCGCYNCGSTYEPSIIKEWETPGKMCLKGDIVLIEREYGEKELLSSHKFGLVGKGVDLDGVNTDLMVQGIEKGDTAICPICRKTDVISYRSVEGEVQNIQGFRKYLKEVNKKYYEKKEEVKIPFTDIDEQTEEALESNKEVKIELELLEKLHRMIYDIVYEDEIDKIIKKNYEQMVQMEEELGEILDRN